MIKNNLINIEQAKVEVNDAFWFGLTAGSLITLYLVSSLTANQNQNTSS